MRMKVNTMDVRMRLGDAIDPCHLANDGMRRPMRCAGGRCAANCLRCNAMRAGWLHSRGAGGTMLLTEGF